VRELKNVVERAAILSGDVITIADLPEDPHASPFDDDAPDADDDGAGGETRAAVHTPPTPGAQPEGGRLTLREYRELAERNYIVDTLRAFEWNISRTAIALGVERTNLHKKIRAYGVKRGE
jgi:DNA-binding NtrC family response regulator